MPVVKDVPARFSAVLYVGAAGLRTEPDFRANLTDMVVGRQLYPLPVPVLPPNIQLAVPWFAASSSDGVYSLSLVDTHFEFKMDGPPAMERHIDIPDLPHFVAMAAATLGETLDLSGRLGTRVGLVTEHVATDRVHRACGNMEVGARLMHLPPEQAERRPTEWQWKIGYRVGDGDDAFNVFANLSGVSGTLGADPFNGVIFQFDANTMQENTRPRFGRDHLAPTLDILAAAERAIEEQVDLLIGEF